MGESKNAAAEVAATVSGTGSFGDAGRLVVDYLAQAVPMGLWAVSRVVDDRQVMLTVCSPGYPVQVGTDLPFPTSLCAQMASGRVPGVAADTVATPGYLAAVAAAGELGFPVGAYAGASILGPSGELFGTVCGYNPAAAPEVTEAVQPLLTVFARLLSTVLAGDLALTEAQRAHERARALADVDDLTGLLNRRGWNRFLEREEARFRRFGDPATIIVIDVDDFKTVNDTHGHHTGDRLLQSAAQVIRSTARAADVVARLGGDEFGIIAIGADGEHADTFVRRLERALADTGLTVSIGYASHSVRGGFSEAWEQADTAMYANKRRRRAAGDDVQG